MNETDHRYMRLALSLGRRGQGKTWPNPPVGCVIVAEGRIVGRGWTAPGGRPHAEPQALAQAGHKARGATTYVTLEPCAHHGQTPPCADALIAAGVARVVIATQDPDPRVCGRGAERLSEAGISVTAGICESEARRDLVGFLNRITLGRPFVTLKLASSFDGRIATASGHSQWITAPPARRLVHALRARSDAVLVGGGTARADDPMLTVRDLGHVRQPVRIVFSRTLNLPIDGKLTRSAQDVPLWICHGPDISAEQCADWQKIGARLIETTLDSHGQIDPTTALHQLGAQGLTRVFCEGGGALAASLLRADLVDELIGFTAGLAIGADSLAAVGEQGLARLDEAPRFHLREQRQIGPDLMHVWQRRLTP